MGNENSRIPLPNLKADSGSNSNTSAFPYVRGSREARLRSHQVLINSFMLMCYYTFTNPILIKIYLFGHSIFQITREMQKQFSDDSQVIKILLLGAGESGKSTIVKQMKLLHPVNKRTECGFNLNGKVTILHSICDFMLHSFNL